MRKMQYRDLTTKGKLAVSLLTAAILTIAAGAGCGGNEDVSITSSKVSTSKASAESVGQFARGLPDGYPILADSPTEMAGLADVVVRGEISNFTDGPVYYGETADDPGAVTSTIMRIDVDEVDVGELPTGSGGSVWVELFGMDPKTAAESGPIGQEALIYLRQLPESGSVDPGVPVSDYDAGRPDEQPSFTPARAQGFMVAVGNEVIQPAMRQVFEGSTLDDFGPSRERFPAAGGEDSNSVAG
jgi:hypothetical protein